MNAGYDGVAYNSALRKGLNYALFDWETPTIDEVALIPVTGVGYDIGTPLRNVDYASPHADA
jgi:hypothetical protein